jgi:hypothetical protein
MCQGSVRFFLLSLSVSFYQVLPGKNEKWGPFWGPRAFSTLRGPQNGLGVLS